MTCGIDIQTLRQLEYFSLKSIFVCSSFQVHFTDHEIAEKPDMHPPHVNNLSLLGKQQSVVDA